MQKRKKQLLGLAGLVLVVAMTAIAFAMPTPGVSAEEANQHGVGIKVTVDDEVDPGPGPGPDNPGPDDPYPNRTTVNIVAIDGMSPNNSGAIITTKRKVQVKVEYRRAENVDIQIKDAAGNVLGTGRCGSYSTSTSTCTATIDLDSKYLAKDPKNGDKLIAVATATHNGSSYPDTVEFIYRSAYIYSKGEYEDRTHNPIIYAVLNSDVKHAVLQVFDANGKSVLKQPITFSYADVDPVTGQYKIVLPFKEHNLPAGKYTAVLTAYSTETPSEDGLVSISTITDIVYTPDGGPLPPDTGSNLFQNLNISRADYIVTGLVAFGMVTAFAVFLIVRRNKR